MQYLIGLPGVMALVATFVVNAAESVPFQVQSDAVFMYAARAEQAADHRSFAFTGDFTLERADWRIDADSAVVSGRLEDPDRYDLSGYPAHISIARKGETKPLTAHSEKLVFDPHARVLELSGMARVDHDRQSISSSAIRYLLDHDTFAAGQGGRVRVVTMPK